MADELDSAIAELEADLGKKQSPNRYHAREILMALGRLVLAAEEEGGEHDAGPASARIEKATAEHAEAWQAAIREELLLAGAEHTQAIDPRFLDHPRYDFAYTVAARARLEARLRSAPLLGHEVA